MIAYRASFFELVRRALGYRGDYSFEVFNDDDQQMPQATVVARARASALGLAEDILRRSVPLLGHLKRLEPGDSR